MSSGEEVPEDVLTYIIKAGQEVNGDDGEKMQVMIDEFVLFFIAGMWQVKRGEMSMISGFFSRLCSMDWAFCLSLVSKLVKKVPYHF